MKFRLPGATAIAAALVAFAAPATLALAPAYAQQGQQKPPQLTKAMGAPMNDAAKALQGGDWATAKTKLDAAEAAAKTVDDHVALDKLWAYLGSQTKDGPMQVKAINALIASNKLTPDETKQYKGSLAKAYLDAGDQPGSLAAYRAFIDQYGGTADQLISIANDSAKANDFATAATYAEKAIAKARETGTPQESWLRLHARALKATGQLDKYAAITEQTLIAYPASANKELYWKELIVPAQEAPKFGPPVRLDIYRTMLAAGLKLSANERSSAADEALNKRFLPGEALAILEPASAELTSEFDKKNLATAKTQAAADKSTLDKDTADAVAKGDGSKIAKAGEAQYVYGNYAKAVEVLNAAIAKGIADPGELALTKLHLGMAQLKAGDKAAAQATFADVGGDNGAAILAKNWILISKVGA